MVDFGPRDPSPGMPPAGGDVSSGGDTGFPFVYDDPDEPDRYLYIDIEPATIGQYVRLSTVPDITPPPDPIGDPIGFTRWAIEQSLTRPEGYGPRLIVDLSEPAPTPTEDGDESQRKVLASDVADSRVPGVLVGPLRADEGIGWVLTALIETAVVVGVRRSAGHDHIVDSRFERRPLQLDHAQLVVAALDFDRRREEADLKIIVVDSGDWEPLPFPCQPVSDRQQIAIAPADGIADDD